MKAFQSLLVGVLVTTSLYTTATPANAATAAAPLIERSKLFGNPSRSGASLSPNGQWLSWLAVAIVVGAARWRHEYLGCTRNRSWRGQAVNGLERSSNTSVVLVAR